MEFELEVENLEENFEEKTESEKTESEVKQQKQSPPFTPFCKCKKCGGAIVEFRYFYACEHYCGVKIWKEFLYKQLTEQEIRALLEGKEIYLTELKSGSGKIFNAYACYDFDQCKVILRFENSNKQNSNKQGKDSKQNKQESKQKKSKK